MYICGCSLQPEAIGHSQTCLQPESGASQSYTLCGLVIWEVSHFQIWLLYPLWAMRGGAHLGKPLKIPGGLHMPLLQHAALLM